MTNDTNDDRERSGVQPGAAGPAPVQNLASERIGELAINELLAAREEATPLLEAMQEAAARTVESSLGGFDEMLPEAQAAALANAIDQTREELSRVGAQHNLHALSAGIQNVLSEADLQQLLASIVLFRNQASLPQAYLQAVVHSSLCKHLLSLVSSPSCRLKELIMSLWPVQCQMLEALVLDFQATDPGRNLLSATSPKRVAWSTPNPVTGVIQLDHPQIVFYERIYGGTASEPADQIVGFGYPITQWQTDPEYGCWVRFTNAQPSACP